jgi:hypothetical protein
MRSKITVQEFATGQREISVSAMAHETIAVTRQRISCRLAARTSASGGTAAAKLAGRSERRDGSPPSRRTKMMAFRVFIVSLLTLSMGCHSDDEWTDLRGRPSTDCVWVVFVEGAPAPQVFALLKAETSTPHPVAGDSLRKGISGLVLHRKGTSVGYDICFAKTAPPSAKQQLMERFKRSPLVAEILDDDKVIRATR